MNKPTRVTALVLAIATLLSNGQVKGSMCRLSEQRVVTISNNHTVTSRTHLLGLKQAVSTVSKLSKSVPKPTQKIDKIPITKSVQDKYSNVYAFVVPRIEKYGESNSTAKRIVRAAIKVQQTLRSNYHLNIKLSQIFGIIEEESNFKRNEVSSEGATGLMQLTHGTWKQQVAELHKKDLNDTDVEDNILVGAYLFASLQSRYGTTGAIVAYAVGDGNLKHQIYRELDNSKSYYYRIFKSINQYKEIDVA